MAHADGGWAYAPGQPPQVEPTCLGLLACSLEADRFADAIGRARQFLDRCRKPDGSYRLAVGREEALWPTSLALFTQAVLDDGAAKNGAVAGLRSTAAYLLGVKGRTPENMETDELHDIDLKLTGWPWAENNFSWVEPTAWACLALRAAGHENQQRVQEGLQMLLDRAMDEGGINYGNRRILGRLLEPIPGPTALMLLALQGRDQPRITAAAGYLLTQTSCGDLEHLCWMKLALDAHRTLPGVEQALPGLDAAIAAAYERRRQTPWLRPAPLREALTALALGTERKNFFKLAAKSQAAAVVPVDGSRQASLGQRFGKWFRGLAVKAAGQLRQLPEFSGIHIARAPNYDSDLTAILQQQFDPFRAKTPLKDKRVVLKPNLVEYHRDKVINTDPRVVSAVIELCKREGAREIIVAEGPGHWRNVEYLVRESGLGEVLEKQQVPFVDLNHDEPVKTPNLGRLTGLEYLYLTRTITSADVLISLPKLKTHHWAGATLSLKNLFGTLPGICYGWPKNELHWRGIDNSIVDIALTRTPDLAIVDAVIGMEGDGPLNGTAKPFGALVMGADLVAVDATCCRLMQLDPERIGYLVLGHMKKLGRLHAAEIPQLGESIDSLAQPFETVPHLENLRAKRSA
ncbi:MAG: DUF362 domain-containing protein [Planctomycetes bacterium]|nr:DUF362 domain-containing protein [Planctomycetota bacterium]